MKKALSLYLTALCSLTAHAAADTDPTTKQQQEALVCMLLNNDRVNHAVRAELDAKTTHAASDPTSELNNTLRTLGWKMYQAISTHMNEEELVASYAASAALGAYHVLKTIIHHDEVTKNNTLFSESLLIDRLHNQGGFTDPATEIARLRDLRTLCRTIPPLTEATFSSLFNSNIRPNPMEQETLNFNLAVLLSLSTNDHSASHHTNRPSMEELSLIFQNAYRAQLESLRPAPSNPSASDVDSKEPVPSQPPHQWNIQPQDICIERAREELTNVTPEEAAICILVGADRADAFSILGSEENKETIMPFLQAIRDNAFTTYQIIETEKVSEEEKIEAHAQLNAFVTYQAIKAVTHTLTHQYPGCVLAELLRHHEVFTTDALKDKAQETWRMEMQRLTTICDLLRQDPNRMPISQEQFNAICDKCLHRPIRKGDIQSLIRKSEGKVFDTAAAAHGSVYLRTIEEFMAKHS